METRYRRALIGVLAAALLVTSFGACTRPGRPRPTTTTTTTVTRPGTPVTGRYAERVFEQIEQVARAETYKPANNLKLDAWAPAGDTAEKRPAIVWAFGGAWIAGERTQMNTHAQDSARRGYVGITIDYRKLGVPAGIVPAYEDMLAAVQWVKTNAARFRIDPDAVVAGGFSAGAINAVNVVVMPGTAGQPGPATSPAAGAISVSGASFGAMQGRNWSRANQGPIVMFGGTADAIVNYQNWQVRTCNDHRAAGNVCEMNSYPGAGHMPTSTSEILDKSAAFVTREILRPRGY
jgi:hypothetical protein